MLIYSNVAWLSMYYNFGMESNVPTSLMNTIHRWGLKGGLGILDQAIFSGANFLTSVFLARWLSNEDFGEFAIGFAVLSFFMQVYTSFALEPIGILGPSGYRDRIVSYLLGQVRLLFLLSVPTGILSGLIIWLVQFSNNHSVAASVLIFSTVGLPFILFPLLMRRVFYVLLKPGLALIGSVVYFLVLIFIFYWARRYGILNGANSILIISLAGLLSGLILLLFLRNENSASDRIDLITILSETWSFGKWLIVSGVLIGLATQSQIYLTGLLSNIEDAGAVRILQTFIQPMMLTATAFSALATPAITADFASGAYEFMRRKIFLFTVLLGGIALFYECLLVLFGGRLNQFLFEGKYLSYTNQIPIWGFIPLLLAFFWGGAISLQASQKPQAMLIISGIWAFFSFVPGLIIIPVWGAWGATISIISGFVAAFVITWVLYWFWVHKVYMDDKR